MSRQMSYKGEIVTVDRVDHESDQALIILTSGLPTWVNCDQLEKLPHFETEPSYKLPGTGIHNTRIGLSPEVSAQPQVVPATLPTLYSPSRLEYFAATIAAGMLAQNSNLTPAAILRHAKAILAEVDKETKCI